jgi:hypothetical protein
MRAASARLDMLTRNLWSQWQETKEHWRDAKSLEFERKYLEELRPGVDNAVAVIAQLDKLLAKIKKDCE